MSHLNLSGMVLLLAILVCGQAARAQDTQSQELPAPPPLKKVAADDRSKLSTVTDFKARTRLSIQLSESHLARAEQLTTESQFHEASGELGRYQGIIEDALQFLGAMHDTSNKVRDAYKRIELALRAHTPRLETIRRSTPREYAVNIKVLTEYARDAREEALNAFYGDTVLREPKPQGQKGFESEHGKNPSSQSETKKP